MKRYLDVSDEAFLMRICRVLALLAAIVVAGSAVVAQQPPAAGASQGQVAGGGRQGGRGFGRGGVQIQDGEECPPGMTEVRPRSCQAPSMPPPSIVDYRPKSTLVTAVHLVPKAKFPA
ncbi:MAG: hypothetical protein ABI818_12255, partial [Acidobacteriota bacterium]